MRLFLVVLLMLGGASTVLAQAAPATYPRNVDLGVSEIFLSFRKTSEDVLGDGLVLKEVDSQREEVRCVNKDGSEELILTHLKGRGKNSFQQFKVRKSSGGEVLESEGCRLEKVTSFQSFRGVRLGMSVGELTKILGEQFRVEAKGLATIVVYRVETNVFSAFLQHYSELNYTGRYTFRDGKLIEYEFGFNL